MIEFTAGDFADLCRAAPVRLEMSTIEEKRKAAVRIFWLYFLGGVVLTVAIAWSLIAAGWFEAGAFLGTLAFILGLVFALRPLAKASDALKHPVLAALAAKGGLDYLATGFDPPVYPDAREALFGNWLSSQVFTDLFHGAGADGRRFAIYEATLKRKSGKNTRTVFVGQIYAFQRRARSNAEIVIVPDRGIFNFFKPLKGMERVRFEADPAFEKRFEVYAYRPHEALALVGSDLRRKLLDLGRGGRVFAYVGAEDALVAAWGANRFEPGSMFRSRTGEQRVRLMFDDVRASLATLRGLKAGLD